MYILILSTIAILLIFLFRIRINRQHRNPIKLIESMIELEKSYTSNTQLKQFLDTLKNMPWVNKLNTVTHSSVWILLSREEEKGKYNNYSITVHGLLEDFPYGKDCDDKYILETWNEDDENRKTETGCLNLDELLLTIGKFLNE